MGATHGQLGAAGHGHDQPPCRGDRPPARGRLAAAKAPLQRGDRLRPCPLQGVATRRGSSPADTTDCGQPARGCRRWRLPTAKPQGAAPRPRMSPARETVGRSGLQQGQRPREAVPPTREVPPEGSSGCPRRRRAAPPPAQRSGGGAADVGK
ncbi:hypothetical protein BHM03_00052684 [Ensete ventricosum]|nr:hypothetical protein BHM03_00052684 [Ensete ventricosum]